MRKDDIEEEKIWERKVRASRTVYQKAILRVYDPRRVAYEATGKCVKIFNYFETLIIFHSEVLFQRKIKYEVARERESSENAETFLSFTLIFNFTYNMCG